MIQKEKRKFSKGNLNNGNSKLLCLIQLNLINYLDERNPIPLKVSKPTNSFTSTEELRPGTDAATYKVGDDPLSIIMKQMQGLNQELTTLKSTMNQNNSHPNKQSPHNSKSQFQLPPQTSQSHRVKSSELSSYTKSLNATSSLSSVSDNENSNRYTAKKCEKQRGNSRNRSKHPSNNKENGEINETRKSGRIRNNLDYFKTHNGVLLDD